MFCLQLPDGKFQVTEDLEWQYKWEKNPVTYAVLSDSDDIQKELQDLNLAMTTWDIRIPLTLKKVKPTDNPDITLWFRLDDPILLKYGALAYSDFPVGSKKIKIVVNDILKWKEDGFPNLRHTLIHEIGHALGLTHSSIKDDVMYAYYNGRLELNDNDIIRIQNKYGKSNPADRLVKWLYRRIRRV